METKDTQMSLISPGISMLEEKVACPGILKVDFGFLVLNNLGDQ